MNTLGSAGMFGFGWAEILQIITDFTLKGSLACAGARLAEGAAA